MKIKGLKKEEGVSKRKQKRQKNGSDDCSVRDVECDDCCVHEVKCDDSLVIFL